MGVILDFFFALWHTVGEIWECVFEIMFQFVSKNQELFYFQINFKLRRWSFHSNRSITGDMSESSFIIGVV